MIVASHGIIGSSIGQVDADALAFFSRVTAAGGTLSATEKTAVNTLVVKMKFDGIWNSMKAIYPMVGASAAACAQNLKSSSFTGTFTATGWTFASTGVKGDAINNSMNTTIIPINDLSRNNTHISIYIRTDNDQGGVDMGSERLTIQLYTGSLYYLVNNSSYTTLANIPSNKFFLASRIVSSSIKMYENGINTSTGSKASDTMDSKTLRIGSWYDNLYPTNREYAFASIGEGLTDQNATDLYNAVQAMQTTLNRAIAP